MKPKHFPLAILLGFMVVSMSGCEESSETLTVPVVIPAEAVSAAVLEEKARQEHASGMHYLLIDLSEVSSMTSVGLRAIRMINNLLSDKVSLLC